MSVLSSQNSNDYSSLLSVPLLQQKIEELEAENERLRSLLLKCKCHQKLEGICEMPLPTTSNKHMPSCAENRTLDSLDIDNATKRNTNQRIVALKIMYFGKRFHGFSSDAQVEPTVESELFKALKKTKLLLTNNVKEARYSRCGRTDKGVSACGQVVALCLRSKLRHPDSEGIHFEDYVGREIDYPKVINRALPDDIRVLGWSPVTADFSARFSCLSRQYKYFFWDENLDLQAMANGGQKFIGEHDFRNFCKMDAENVHNYKRRVTFFSVSSCGSRIDGGHQLCVVTIKGSAFLWHQVRCMVAVLFMIGQGLESPDIIDTLLDVQRTNRKPQYLMAPQTPLLLHDCDFQGFTFYCSSDVQRSLNSHLKAQYLAHHLQAQIFIQGLVCLPHASNDGILSRKLTHIPLLCRPTEPSYLERRARKIKTQTTD